MTAHWAVSINNGQKNYVVEAETAGDAAVSAGNEWRADPSVKPRQHAKGIYDIRVRRAKFGEVRQQVILPLRLVDG